MKLSKFLENFSPIPLHHMEPVSLFKPWVFWKQYDGSQNNSSTADLITPVIHEKIISALSDIQLFSGYFVQFWAPVRIGGRRLLSTSGQPFAVSGLSDELAKYRVYSEKYKYNIDDVNQLDNYEGDHMIISGGPASAFLNRLPCINQLQWIPTDDCNDEVNLCFMLPICFPSQNSCIGVLEFTMNHSYYDLGMLFPDAVTAIKNAGLDVFLVQDLLPYKAVDGLEHAKDEIQKALKVVCESHNLALAQVWIAHEDKNNVPYSYFSEDIQTKRLLAIKLTGYRYAAKKDFYNFNLYLTLGNITPRAITEELTPVTLQDYESRYVSKLHYDMLVDWKNCYFKETYSALAICLRSNDTGDFDYAFEFIWIKKSNNVIFLEDLLLTLKRCLPKFKLASGVELGNELDVHNKDDETKFKIFQVKQSTVVDHMAPSEVTSKTTPKVLPREVIEKQFGKTMKDAAKNLNVSLSTLKRKIKELGILEWPGPNFVKRNKNDSSIIQINTNEEDNGATEETSIVNPNKNFLTIKAEYADDMIKFHLPLSQATFVIVKKEIGMRLKLSDRTYKIKYLDEDGDWISLTSNEEMLDCIKSSRKSDRIVVRMRVLPFHNQHQVK